MKKIFLITAILFTSITCMADNTYKHAGYFGNDTVGCYEKMCNTYNCYDKQISCWDKGYLNNVIREALTQTFLFEHGRYPTEQELNNAVKGYYNHYRGTSNTNTNNKKTTTKQTVQKTATQKQTEAKVKAEEQNRLAEEKRKQEEYERTRPNAGFSFPYVSGVSPELIKSYYFVSKMPHDEFDKYPLGELNYYEYTDITPKGKIVKRLTRAFTMNYYKKADTDDIKKFQTIEKEYDDLIAREWRITQSNLLKQQFKLEEKYKGKTVRDMMKKEEIKLMYAMKLPEGKNMDQVLDLKMGSIVDMTTMTPVNIMEVDRDTYLKGKIKFANKYFIGGIQRVLDGRYQP